MPKAKIINKCMECGEPVKTRKSSVLDDYICSNCLNTDKYTLIYTKYVISDYFIDICDLDDCDVFYKNFGRYGIGKLYRMSDVYRIFGETYDVDSSDKDAIKNKIEEIRKDKEIEKEKRRKTIALNKKEKMDVKKKRLCTALNEHGLELRDDSKLCHGYIDGTIKGWTVSEIVQRMCQMKYLYDYCNMDACYEKAVDEQRDELAAGYFPDCSPFEQAELIALENCGGYPKTWPWLK